MMKYIILFLFLVSGPSSAQFLTDNTSRVVVEKALEKMYNAEWDSADHLLRNVHEKYNNHPVSFLLKATELQLRYAPIESYPSYFKKYITYLEKCNSLAKEGLNDHKWAEEFTFYMLASSGYIAQAHHHQKDYLKAAAEGRKAYSYMKDGFEMAEANPEFYFTNGLYKYYREQYPETHPSIKPFIVFFAKGDKKEGIAELRKARSSAMFTKNEASMFLVGVYLKYENEPKDALRVATALHKNYPQNQIFFMRYIEALLASGNKALASYELRKYQNFTQGALGQLSYYLFLGQVEADSNMAKAYFAKALQVQAKGRFVDDYRSMAFVKLGESFLHEGKKVKAEQFLKEADELAEYTWVKAKVTELKEKLND